MQVDIRYDISQCQSVTAVYLGHGLAGSVQLSLFRHMHGFDYDKQLFVQSKNVQSSTPNWSFFSNSSDFIYGALLLLSLKLSNRFHMIFAFDIGANFVLTFSHNDRNLHPQPKGIFNCVVSATFKVYVELRCARLSHAKSAFHTHTTKCDCLWLNAGNKYR